MRVKSSLLLDLKRLVMIGLVVMCFCSTVSVNLSLGVTAEPQKPDASEARNLPMSFFMDTSGGNCDTCVWTAAQGFIVEETPELFEKFFKEFIGEGKCYYFISFNSPGGSIIAAMKLGRLIRRHGCNTDIAGTRSMLDPLFPGFRESVDGSCESACALAFFGGVQRSVPYSMRDRVLGVHQFHIDLSFPGSLDGQAFALGMSQSQYLQSLIISYLSEMGIDLRVAAIAANTSAENMRYFSREEILSLNIDNVSPVVGKWQIEANINGAIATHKSREADKTEELIIYCSRDNPSAILMLFSRKYRGKRAELNPLSASFIIDDERIDLDYQKCSMCGMVTIWTGETYNRVPLPPLFLNGVLQGQLVLFMVPLSHAEGWSFTYEDRIDDDAQRGVISLATRNCI